MGNRYLKTENELLRELYPTATKVVICKRIPNHGWTALSAHARHMGLHRTMETKGREIQAGLGKENHYTEEENQMLRDHYPKATRVELMDMFPTRTWVGLSIHAQRLGVRRMPKIRRNEKE